MIAQELVKYYGRNEKLPSGWHRINDPAFRDKKGGYAATEPVARIVNNHLGKGLYGNPIFNLFMWPANLLNQFQLGISPFHLFFTGVDTMSSKWSLAQQQLMAGKPLKAAVSYVEAAVPFYSPIRTALKGRRLAHYYERFGPEGISEALMDTIRERSAAKTPQRIQELDQILLALDEAGGRVKMDMIYKNSSIAAARDAFKSGNIIGGILRTPPAIVEAFAWPIMEKAVPFQKLGVFHDLVKFEVEKAGGWKLAQENPAKFKEIVSRAWDSVDNRLGQIVYDDLGWNKVLKDVGHVGLRSLGWNLGTLRELGGGVYDLSVSPIKRLIQKARARLRGEKVPEPVFELTPRASYVIAFPQTIALLGAITYYLYNQDWPRELIDYFFPSTGREDKYGNKERVALPSYLKDVVQYSHDPAATLSHKMHPLLQAITDMLHNKDFYGVEIRHKGDPLMEQAEDSFKYLGEQFTPFSWRNYQRMIDTGTPEEQARLAFLGIIPAPAWLEKTPAQRRAIEILVGKLPQGAQTREEFERRRIKNRLQNQKYAGENVIKEASQAYNEGRITRDDYREIIRQPRDPFRALVSRFSDEELQEVLKLANDQEAATINRILRERRLK